MENEYSKSLKQQYLDRLTSLHQFVYIDLPQKIMTDGQTSLYNLIENGFIAENERKIQYLIEQNATLQHKLKNSERIKTDSGKDFSFDNKENLENNQDLTSENEYLKQKVEELNRKLMDKENDLTIEKNKNTVLQSENEQLNAELKKLQESFEGLKEQQTLSTRNDQKQETQQIQNSIMDDLSEDPQENQIDQKLEQLQQYLVEYKKDFDVKQELQSRSFEDRIQELERSMELKLVKIQSENQRAIQELQLKMSFRLDKRT